MNWVFAIAITFGILVINVVGTLLLSAVSESAPDIFKWIVIGACSVWIGFDAQKIEIQKYKGFVSGPPIGFAICNLFFFLIVFPLYLQKRFKIKQGKVELKDDDKSKS